MLKILNCCNKVNYIVRSISVCRVTLAENQSHKKKVKETVELVTLVDSNDKILGIKTKTDSEKLARKLNLNLERVYDTKYGKTYPAFKMFATSDLLRTEKKASTAKVLKKLPINCRISDHDLALKVQIIRKWIAKDCEVHVAITSNNESPALMKSVFNKIQDLLKGDALRILDIRNKDTTIKFIVIPPKKTDKTVASTNSKTNIAKSDENS